MFAQASAPVSVMPSGMSIQAPSIPISTNGLFARAYSSPNFKNVFRSRNKHY